MQIPIYWVKIKHHLLNFLISTGVALSQEDFTECSDNQKEENVDGQDNVDKCKEIKTEEHEKEISIKKEIKEVLYTYWYLRYFN